MTIRNGHAQAGAGIYNSGNLTITSTTISGNRACCIPFGGAGIYNVGTLTIDNSTVSENEARCTILQVCSFPSSGGGIYGSATLQNSIVAYCFFGGNCSGAMISKGYNLSSDGTCGFSKKGDWNSTDPMLGPLQNNGGPTQTMALPLGSPAIDAGNPYGCTDGHGHLLTTDQRGMPRPDPEDKTKTGCDIGAYESQSY